MASGRFIRAHDSRAEGFARPTTFFVFLPARERIVARDFLDVNRHWLAHHWSALVLRMFPDIARFNGRLLLLADGIKAPKSGRKMPAVKKLDQASDSNTKPPYIMGHSCQAVSLLAGGGNRLFAVPLAARIHEGVVSPIATSARSTTSCRHSFMTFRLR